jgi:HSP20 family protein
MAAIAERTEKQEKLPVRSDRRFPVAREFPFFLSRMRGEFERLFERMTHAWPDAQMVEGWRWGLDVEDLDDKVIVRAESPGFEPGDFDVRVSDGQLTLSASRKDEVKDKEGKVRETRLQECCETVSLPPGVDKNKVEARYVNGVLTVTVPKTDEGRAKRIAVKGG